MKILVLGSGLFVAELRLMGHDVVTCGTAPNYDVILSAEKFSLENIVALLGCWVPDVCLFTETLGDREFPEGLHRRPFPLVYYSIDTHLNFFWLRHFATSCDAVITTQKDYVPLLRQFVPRAYWLPWSNNPREYFDEGLERDIPISFVGAVDDFRPRRKALLSLVSTRFPIHVFDKRLSPPEVNTIYSRSKIVLNEAIAGEVNFRVFEAMASGAMLLTDRIDNGLTDLFVDGRHLVTFAPEDVLNQISRYLSAEGERAAIAAAGSDLVNALHTRDHRAQQLLDILQDVPSVPAIRPGRLGKAYFLMLRRGLLPEGAATAMTYQTLMEEGSGCSTGERLGDLAGFLTAFGDGEAGRTVYRRLVTAERPDSSILRQWALLLLEERHDDEAAAVLRILEQHVQGEEQQLLADALLHPFPSVEVFTVLAGMAEADTDSSVPGFVHYKGRDIPFSGTDVIRIGLCRHSDHPDLLELQGDLCVKTFAPVLAADFYLRATGAKPCGRLLRKAARALADGFMLDAAVTAASSAWQVFHDPEALEMTRKFLVAAGTSSGGEDIPQGCPPQDE